MFGDPSETGKPAGDDLREGKRTVLVAKALAHASPAQADVVARLLGDPQLDADGVRALREIIVETGALASVERLVEELVDRSLTALAAAAMDPTASRALSGLVTAATVRVS